MMNSKNSSTKNLTKEKKTKFLTKSAQTEPRHFIIRKQNVHLGLLGLAFLGFLDASYLTVLSLTHQIPPCSLLHGCERVLTSSYSHIGPIPIAAFGMLYFLSIMILSLFLFQKFHHLAHRLLVLLSSLALVLGLGLVYIQAGVLKAFCQFCVLAELLMLLIFLFTMLDYHVRKRRLHMTN